MRNITKNRIDFYLDKDGICRWKYITLIDYGEPRFIITRIPVALGQCEVCGKNPIRYNFILQYIGNEKGYKYASVGSECIDFLVKEDYLNYKKDLINQKKENDKKNAILMSKYLKKIIENNRTALQTTIWHYMKDRSLLESLEWALTELSAGNNVVSGRFGSALRKELKKLNIDFSVKSAKIDAINSL